VSGISVSGVWSFFRPLICIAKEAWKKRPLFPEDIVNSNFHASLLLIYPLSQWERTRVRENKELFIHNRDEEFSFDKLRTGLRGTTQFVN
jgi:hypothetical protein